MEDIKVTLKDIADKAHVSVPLVSRVLNNRPVRVSEQKREQILRIADELEYIPTGKLLSFNPLPQLNKTIGLILPLAGYLFMSELTESISQIAYENGYSLLIFDTQEDSALEFHYLKLCHTLNVSGIILDSFADANSLKYVKLMKEWGIPFVFVDCYPNVEDCSIISSKNKQAMSLLTENLIQKGHTKILSIIQNKSTLTNVSMERLNGYYEAMDKHHLEGYNAIIYPNRDYTQQPIFSLLNSSIEFTAFLIHTGADVDHFCSLILPTRYYKEHIDFSIGVFDDFNIPFLEYNTGIRRSIYHRITSVISQRPQEIGKWAIDTLLKNIKNEGRFSYVQKFIDCDLVDLDHNRRQ